MAIDFHTHIGRWKYPAYYGLRRGAKELLKDMKSAKVEGAVVAPTDTKDNKGTLNDLLANGKGDFWFFAWVDPSKKGTMAFLERNIDNIAGIKMHGSLNKLPLTSKKYGPFLKFAERNGLIALCHAGRYQKLSSYKHTLKIAKENKGVRFVMAHQGGDDPKLKVEAAKAVGKSKLGNVWLDTSATREYWTIDMGVKFVGAERFLFGSDYPVMHPKMSIETIESTELSRAQKEKIFSKNAKRLLPRRKVI